MVEIETYPKLLEAIPCLEKNVFRACISEEARKELIYGSARFCGMNYNPPPINKNASSTVKKMDSAMYRIQSMLANLTRLMDQYVHDKLRMEPNTDILNNRDLEHNLMIREIIADIAAHITQLRIEHVHKTMEFQRKVPQLMETSIRPLIEVKQMDMLVAAKKAEKRSAARNTTQNRKLFHQRQRYTPLGVAALLLQRRNYKKQIPTQTVGQQATHRAYKQIFGGEGAAAGAENRPNRTAHQPPVGQEHCRKGVKNPIQIPQYSKANFGSLIKESDNQFERVFGANAPRCFNNFTRPKVNATPKPIQKENYIGGKRDSDNGSGNSSLKESHRRSKRLTQRSFKTNKDKADNSTKSGKLYRKGTGYVNSSATGTIYVDTSPRIEKEFSRKIKTVDFAGCYNRTSNSKFKILEDTIESMERSVISPGDARDRSIYRRQRHSLGNYSKLAVLLRLMEPVTGVDAYQRQKVIDYIICPTAKECGWSLCVSLFRQHYNFSVCKKVWGASSPKLLEISENIWKHCINTNTRPQADGSNRMVNDSSDVYNTEQDIRNSRRGSICVLQECKNKELLQLVCRPQGSGSERTNLQLAEMGQSILLLTVELDCTSYTKAMWFPDLMELSTQQPLAYGHYTSPATCSNSDSRSQKRKIAVLEKQTLALSGLEDQRRALENQGLKDYAVDFIVSNKRRVRRRARYSAAQQRFLDWRLSNKIVGDITAPQKINYLAEIYTADELRLNTIRACKSAIMGLVKYPEEINNSQVVIEFFKTLNEFSIKSFVKPKINILTVLNTLSNWGLNSELSVKDLTTKLAWLLAVTGMLRASDIHRIDDARSQIINGSLHLVIVAPKEKRGGQPIERPCQIMEHTNPSICPVKVYTEYKLRVAFTLCPTPHINNDSLIVNRLLQQLNNYSKPLAVDSITRYIQKLSILIARPDNTSVPKARAIGATLAASAGASTDDIVNHAFWSNYSMFDEYY
ncbi:hypothetical protein BB561_004407 [Smittium simulii]|uniref:Uncharacterized protein n=1 Tax=Smittium simulii TaxID=133385 RepID=A0A2T9YGD3_9FUNG|nr:hypothetical protein BB561_004407 [Smittium simulii]